jgi:hypothetical protein
MSNGPAAMGRQKVSSGLLLFSRVMGWLCWAGVAATVAFSVLRAFGVIPSSDTPADPGSLIAYSSVSLGVHDPNVPRPPLPMELKQDPFYIASRFVPTLLAVWALLSARRVFANIGGGQFFARSTSLGLRNLSLAVLLNMTVAPLATLASHVAFALRMKAAGRHGELYLDFGIGDTTMLVLVFAATVLIISSVMAHAAHVAEENEQFV